KVFSGPVWLAAPGVTDIPAGYANIIGIQSMTGGGFDLSVIFDDYWPNTAPTPVPVPIPIPEGAEMYTSALAPGAKAFVPFRQGSFKSIYLMHDFTTDALVVRVAVHS